MPALWVPRQPRSRLAMSGPARRRAPAVSKMKKAALVLGALVGAVVLAVGLLFATAGGPPPLKSSGRHHASVEPNSVAPAHAALMPVVRAVIGTGSSASVLPNQSGSSSS